MTHLGFIVVAYALALGRARRKLDAIDPRRARP